MSIVVCNNNSLSAITSIPAGISGGSLNLISTQTASSSSTISFTSGIDSTYKEYIFKFYNIHPSGTADDIAFTFNGSADSGSVILRYSSAFSVTVGSGLTSSTSDLGNGSKVTQFTAGTDTISFGYA